MKNNILLLPLILLSSFGFSQTDEITRIIIVRHAEKEDGVKNPSLSATGKLRAEKLNQLLNEVKIDKLFATPYARTIETLQPIATARKLEITNYSPSDTNFATDLLKKEKGKTMVVAGHSNTCPNLVNSLINEAKYHELDEATEYGKIWMVTFKDEKLVDCILLNY